MGAPLRVPRLRFSVSQKPQPSTLSKGRYKNWATNLLILLIVTILMLALAEIALRWLDGYQFSNFRLNQDTTITTPAGQREGQQNEP